MQKALSSAAKYVFIAFLIIFPSFFLNIFVNVFDFPKLILLVLFICLMVVFAIVELATQNKLTLRISNLDLPLIIMTVAFIVSAILRTQNKMEAFVNPGPVTIVIAGFFIFFVANMVFKENKNHFALGLFFSAVLVSLVSIFASTGIFAKIPQLPAFMKDPSFSGVGGKLPEIIFLTSLLPLGIYQAFMEKDVIKKIFYALASVIVILAGVLAVTAILPGKPASPILVDFQTSWSIAVDTLKISPLWGIGPANYLTAFSRLLPITYNNTLYWAVRFSSARSYILTLVTETGVVGFLTFALVLFVAFKKSFKNLKSNLVSKDKFNLVTFISMVILVVSLFLFPANIVLIVLFFLLASLISESEDVTLNLSATRVKNGNVFVSKVPAYILSLLVLGGIGVLGFFSYKAVGAEKDYRMAVDAIALNDAKTAYNDLGAAITKNPYVDRYHATYDQLSLAIASGLAQKKNLTDSDKTTIAQLIQQAINEGKSTVALNSLRSSNWELLARTYQTIIPFAQGADNFTVQTYTQAIALDPINPNLRIALGGVYYALGRYTDAINVFSLAVAAKPDLANAHYNLAIAYRDNKENDKAISEMNAVLSLVQPNSQDYTTVKAELDSLQKNQTSAKAAQSTSNLTAPQPAGTSSIKPPLTLPSEATPPAVTNP